MSGRGRGRGGGSAGGERGWTSKGRSTPQSTNSGGSNNNAKTSKQSQSDSIYYIGSDKQAADYEATRNFLLNYIRQAFNFGNDIATSLETLEEYDMDQHPPSLKTSSAKDEDIKEVLNEQYKIEFNAEFDAFMKR
jgi:hypothetical protein